MKLNRQLFHAVILSVLGLAAAPAAETNAVPRVDVAEFDKLRQNKTNIVLDVRTKKEFDEGHIPGAVHLDFLAGNFADEAGKLDRSRTYLVHCAAGGRSARACAKMSQMGFKSLYDLAPGFKGWEKSGKPVEKK